MRTPAGIECKYFYGDYYRGRVHEKCQLIGNFPPPNNWTPDLCKSCPIPDILQANACPNMVLTAKVWRPFYVFKRRVSVNAFCTKTQQAVTEPKIGCGQCHPMSQIFIEKSL